MMANTKLLKLHAWQCHSRFHVLWEGESDVKLCGFCIASHISDFLSYLSR